MKSKLTVHLAAVKDRMNLLADADDIKFKVMDKLLLDPDNSNEPQNK